MFDEEYKLWSSSLSAFLHLLVTSSNLVLNILVSTLYPSVLRQGETHKTVSNTIVQYLLIFIFLNSLNSYTDSEVSGSKHASNLIYSLFMNLPSDMLMLFQINQLADMFRVLSVSSLWNSNNKTWIAILLRITYRPTSF